MESIPALTEIREDVAEADANLSSVYTVLIKVCVVRGWRESSVGRAFALHKPYPDLIPDTLFGLLSITTMTKTMKLVL